MDLIKRTREEGYRCVPMFPLPLQFHIGKEPKKRNKAKIRERQALLEESRQHRT